MIDFEGQLEPADVMAASRKYIELFIEQATPSELDDFLRHAYEILERGREENQRRKMEMARVGRLKKVFGDVMPSTQGSGDWTRGDTSHVLPAGATRGLDD